ncbi:MAG: hypothetical protein HXS54_06060 [Theionarchaea archaeon]|nr:hypothetical protein [Theionarchaea archaeon]DBA34824.1 TPA_asm: hypothetical protein vir521_00030 [Caudoviricetes sp. vir521]
MITNNTGTTIPKKPWIKASAQAALIKKALQREFPSTKFSVCSSTYSGGASVNITWTDGPCSSEVSKIANQFEGLSSDEIFDTKYSWDTWLLPSEYWDQVTDHIYCVTAKRIESSEVQPPIPNAIMVKFSAAYIHTRRFQSNEL